MYKGVKRDLARPIVAPRPPPISGFTRATCRCACCHLACSSPPSAKEAAEVGEGSTDTCKSFNKKRRILSTRDTTSNTAPHCCTRTVTGRGADALAAFAGGDVCDDAADDDEDGDNEKGGEAVLFKGGKAVLFAGSSSECCCAAGEADAARAASSSATTSAALATTMAAFQHSSTCSIPAFHGSIPTFQHIT